MDMFKLLLNKKDSNNRTSMKASMELKNHLKRNHSNNIRRIIIKEDKISHKSNLSSH